MPELMSLKEAKRLGLKQYFTGVPCPKGHISMRQVAGAQCLECNAERRNALPAEVLERHQEARNARYASDPEWRAKRNAECRAWRAVHGEKYDAKQRLRRQTDPEWREKQNARNRGRPQRHVALKHFYGMTLEDYQTMFEAQGGLCPICLKASDRTLHVDHCHKTGKIRALVCHRCNPGLGHFNDDPAVLRRAADYLEKYLVSE